jgi:outer membrane protein assembly factor BamB
VVWTVSNADEHLRAFNGDTGQLLFTGTDTVSGMHGYNTTLILAKGRIYVAGDNRVYAFTR